eukprot:c43538_g1_i1.p1 GENE.c43538_g1_i1~~c43538_g1_i1.p1  ORF type:complete len:167 (+),score=22.50 c43538_g1_i1:92-592(+)
MRIGQVLAVRLLIALFAASLAWAAGEVACPDVACFHCLPALEAVDVVIDCRTCNLCFNGKCLNTTNQTACAACADGWMGAFCDVEIPRTGHYITNSSMDTSSAMALLFFFACLIVVVYYLYKRHMGTQQSGPSYQNVQLTDLEAQPLSPAHAHSEGDDVVVELVEE